MFSSQVVCRPALPSDRAAVLEFTKFIWDGHDYIKYVWDDWLADPQGVLAVAEYGGRAVGLGKLTRIVEGQWWLEGLRVDPQFQGLKIGSHMFEYLEKWWRERCDGTVRLMTSWERVQVHHLCERAGWAKLGELKEHMAPASEGSHAFRPVAVDQLDSALRFSSARLAYSWGLADIGWKSGAVDAHMLAWLRDEGRLWWWDKGAQPESARVSSAEARGLMGCWEDDDEDGARVMGISFMACDPAALPQMLLDARRLAAARGYRSVVWLAPARPAVEAALAEAAYENRWDGTAWLYGKEGKAVSHQPSAVSRMIKP